MPLKRKAFHELSIWIFSVCLMLVFSGLETQQRVRKVETLSAASRGFTINETDATTKTGYALGVRQLVASDRNDDLHWVVNVQEMQQSQMLRLRYVDYDNAPEGRSVHWSSVYGWWIRVLSFGDAARVEWAALYANLVLVLIVGTLLSFVLLKEWGLVSSVAVLCGLCSIIPFRDVYKFGMGDHHAAAILFVVVGVLLFAIAFLRTVDGRSGATPHLALSSMCLSLAMWVNLVSVLPVLFALGLGGLGICLFLVRDWSEEQRSRVGRMFSLWGRFGASFSLLAYLIEYAPSGFGLRLEVNHPFYSLAWLGCTAVLGTLISREDEWRRMKTYLPLLFLGPLTFSLLVFRADVFQVADPFLRAVHERYIMEFQTLFANLGIMKSGLRTAAMLLPTIVLLLALVSLVSKRLDSVAKALVLMVSLPACIVFLVTLYQARWWAEASGLLIPVLVVIASNRFMGTFVVFMRTVAFASMFPAFAIFVYGAFVEPSVLNRENSRIVEKGVAHYLRSRVGEGDLVVLATPDATTNLIYYGDAKGIGTFYWENAEGLKRAARMFASPNMAVAKERLEEAGVTHVVTYSWGGFEKEYLELYRDFGGDDRGSGKPFLLRLVQDQEIPKWLRPIAFRLPDPKLGVALIFEVVPEMTEGEALACRFEYLFEMGMKPAALGMDKALRDQRINSISARIAYCRLLALSNRRSEFSEELRGVYKSLETGNVLLGLEDRVRYASLLMVAGQEEVARSEFRQIEEMVKLSSWRRLSSGIQKELSDAAMNLGMNALSSRLKQLSDESKRGD